ncbi:hypothetical protein GVX82_03325 [Patescibacteria group bacterium]|jgi:F0F1-type ATP synthase delta subunit|nr:hypothetical protein [Patescibacteria group bacterium]
MLAHAYAHALFDLARAGQLSADELHERFVALLSRKGHRKLYAQVVAAYERLAAQERDTAPTLTLADPGDREALAGEIDRAARALGVDPSTLRVTCDPTLVAGFTLTAGATRFDASQKRALIQLYQTLAS